MGVMALGVGIGLGVGIYRHLPPMPEASLTVVCVAIMIALALAWFGSRNRTMSQMQFQMQKQLQLQQQAMEQAQSQQQLTVVVAGDQLSTEGRGGPALAGSRPEVSTQVVKALHSAAAAVSSREAGSSAAVVHQLDSDGLEGRTEAPIPAVEPIR